MVSRSIVGVSTLCVMALLAPALVSADPPSLRRPPVSAEGLITSDGARWLVDSLASDALRGRMTGEPGLDTAASFLAAELAAAGVEPFEGQWLHPVPLRRTNLALTTQLAVGGALVPLKDAFMPLEYTGAGAIDAPVVFVGYGVSLPDSGYDDYAGIDVRGRIVVAVAGAPSSLESRRRGRAPWAQPREKMRRAAAHGARGFLLLADPRSSSLLRPVGHPWPSLYPSFSVSMLRLRLALPDTLAIPAASINGKTGRAVLGGALFDRLPAVLDRIDTTRSPASEAVGTTARLRVDLEEQRVTTQNVVGVIRGATQPDEYVILGAHYDHVGTGAPGMVGAPVPGDTIYNGADDNASGTAALVMTARAFASLPVEQRPARSILVVAFAAEELGLFGSRAFVATSGILPDRVAAMLNMDMVGRNGRDSISVGGLSTSPELRAIVLEANELEPLVVAENIDGNLYRSDQAAFAHAGIPVAFFHSGEHGDYHRASDHADRIDASKVAHVARLAFRTAWIVAGLERRPGFVRSDRVDPGAAILDY